jgi:diguanylate cyclase (GGDEF)-like protein
LSRPVCGASFKVGGQVADARRDMSTMLAQSDLAERLRQDADRSPTNSGRVRLLLELAQHLDVANQSVRALGIATEAVALAEPIDDPDLLGWSLLRRMMARFNLGHFEDASRDALVCLEAFQRADNAIGQVRARSCRAAALLRSENYEEGFAQLIEATAQIEGMSEVDVQVVNATHTLSDAFGALAAFDHAIALGVRGLRIAEQLNDDAEVVWASYRLADRVVEAADSLATADPERALRHYEQTCEVIEALNPAAEASADLGLRGLIWMLRGIAETGRGRPSVGAELLRRSREVGGAGQSPLELGRLERGLGRALAALDRQEEGRAHLDVAIEAFSQTDSQTELAGALQDRAQVARVLGDVAGACADFEHALKIREAQRTRETERRADGVVARLEVERGLLELRRREHETDELVRIASQDSLTGLANRRTLDAKGASILFDCGDGPVALAVIDIDRFKSINDQHSHLVGDAVLTRIAELLQREVREVDLVARYAGDEFVILFPGIGQDEARAACERLLSAVRREPWSSRSAGLEVTISVGIAAGTGRHALWALFANADAALYAAKETGRNRIRGTE